MSIGDFFRFLFGKSEPPVPMQYTPDVPPTKSLPKSVSTPQPVPRVPAKPAEPLHFEIHDLDDAKVLFRSNNCMNTDRLARKYDAETITAYKALVDSAQMKAWSEEHCYELLQSIIDGDITDCFQKLKTMMDHLNYWGSIAKDGYVPEFVQAWDVIFAKDPNAVNYIEHMVPFLRRTDHRDDLMFQWMDRAVELLRAFREEELEKAGYSSSMYNFKDQVRELRGTRLERNPLEEEEFRFVRMPDAVIETVFRHYSEKYDNSPEALRSEFSGFHFGFGVQNADFFLTASSDAAEHCCHQSFYHYHFTIVTAETGQVYEIECERDLDSGMFCPKSCPEALKAFGDKIPRAVTLYRNRPARKDFEAEIQKTQPEVQLFDLHCAGKEALYARIPKVFDYLKERLPGNPMAETLEALIDFCEEYAPEYGNVEFGDPVPQEEIDAWELRTGITLPEDYKDFLRFANGASLPTCSAEIFSLSEIGKYDEYLEDGYHMMGSAIGDGTMIIFRTSDGEICEEDHGEISEFGGMEGLLEWIMDMV